VRLGCNVDALFSCSSAPSAVSINSTSGYVTPNFCFCVHWDLWVYVCMLVHPRCAMSTHYFSCSGGPGAVSIKDASTHVMPNSFFSSNGIYGSHSACRCVQALNHQHNIFHAKVGPIWISQNARQDTIR
jgi:hypothetical protein